MRTCFYRKLTGPERLAVADLCDYFGHGLIVTRINVPREHRGRGIASEILREICREADAEGVRLCLEVSSSDGLDADQLRDWYERHGFSGSGVMIRMPKLGACPTSAAVPS